MCSTSAPSVERAVTCSRNSASRARRNDELPRRQGDRGRRPELRVSATARGIGSGSGGFGPTRSRVKSPPKRSSTAVCRTVGGGQPGAGCGGGLTDGDGELRGRQVVGEQGRAAVVVADAEPDRFVLVFVSGRDALSEIVT